MLLRQLSRFLVAVLPMCAFAACSDQSPVAPQGVNGGLQSARPSGGTPGTYTMLFRPTPSGLSIILDAYVTDATANPALGGSAVFPFCATRGKPAPSAVCNSGSGRWARVGTAGIISGGTEVGHALRVYDPAPQSVGTTIGFRF